MSAPLPSAVAARGDQFADAFRQRSVVAIPERDTHIFTEYIPHERPQDLTVKQDGVPILSCGKPFTVADVAPERRWAIGPDGEVLAQHVYEAGLIRYREEHYTKLHGKDVPADMRKEAIPTVRKYVSFTVDPVQKNRLKLINYDPRATAGSRAEMLWDSSGENAVPRMDALVRAWHDPKLRERMTEAEKREVAEHLGLGDVVSVMDGIASKLEALTELYNAGDITQDVFARKVAEMTGTRAPAPAPAPEPKAQAEDAPRKPRPGFSFAPCGEEVANVQKRRHIEACPTCTQPAEDDAA